MRGMPFFYLSGAAGGLLIGWQGMVPDDGSDGFLLSTSTFCPAIDVKFVLLSLGELIRVKSNEH